MTDLSARFSNVHKCFGDVDALRGLDLSIPRGGVVALLGRNGAGKSTALRCLIGLERPDRGQLSILGHDPLTWTSHAPAHRVLVGGRRSLSRSPPPTS